MNIIHYSFLFCLDYGTIGETTRWLVYDSAEIQKVSQNHHQGHGQLYAAAGART